jgi:deazaflavin-dependent oxidoreductase (nitroreductase family)
MRTYSDYLRWLYAGGRPNAFARLQNRLSALAFSAGVLPRRVGTLELRGRRSGKVVAFPVVIADYEGERYLVSMLGRESNWVRNLEADHGRAELRHGKRENITLVEVPPSQRAPILRRYLEVAPGARPHVPVDRRAPLQEFERIAPDYPVYRIEPRRRQTDGEAA